MILYKMLLGGSWDFYVTDCRVAVCDGYYPNIRDVNIGFRLKLSSNDAL